jgi:hypothetical protein
MDEDEWKNLLDEEMNDVDIVKAGRGMLPFSLNETADRYNRREHFKSFLKNA